MSIRRSGILLHLTSLPSSYGIGDLGPGARWFVDFLSDSSQSIWQILPVNPSLTVYGSSPYSSYSAFAGNTLFISPDVLVDEGFLLPPDLSRRPEFREDRVEFEAVSRYKNELLHLAWERCRSAPEKTYEFEKFCRAHAHWLDDYALFVCLKRRFSESPWNEWPQEVRDRVPSALLHWQEALREPIHKEKFLQYLFFSQWLSLKAYCYGKHIQVFGDLPIYVSYDSADVWANPQIFKLDEEKRPRAVAGVPPDYFSATGQLWGNPVYAWDVLKETQYDWWIKRLGHILKLFDVVRLDHFRGFVSYWEVPASETTAINGQWVEAPAKDFFAMLLKQFPCLPIVAEDLGTITPDVRETMALFGFPGMKLLLFAFGNDLPTNPYAPHNHTPNSVVYTGTHDNNTIRGWFAEEAGLQDRDRIFQYLGHSCKEGDIHWEFVRMAMMSVSNTTIIPVQDILGLGAEARMNTPSITHGNWEWRVRLEQLNPELAKRLAGMTRLYGRG